MATKQGSSPVSSEKHSSYFQAMYIKQSHAKSFTASAADSRILSDSTSLVRLFATQDCWVAIGASGSVTASACTTDGPIVTSVSFIPGGIYEFLGVPPGITNPVISVISNGTSGTLHILEGA